MRERDGVDMSLVAAGTIAVHVLLLVLIDVGGVYARRDPPRPTPRVEIVDIETPPPPPPPPPPVAKMVEPVKVEPRVRVKAPQPVRPEPVPPPLVDPRTPVTDDPGGAPVVKMDLAATGQGTVAVAVGKRTTERVGQGGSGTGTGAGSGAGTAPAPVSVATIKTLAKPKGNYDAYGKDADYPPEAKRLGIQGPLRVRLVVDATGKVVQRKVLEPKLGHGLDELALARAARFEFEPAKDSDDKPVASVVVWTFNFSLPE